MHSYICINITPSHCHEKPPLSHKSIIDDSDKFIKDHYSLTQHPREHSSIKVVK